MPVSKSCRVWATVLSGSALLTVNDKWLLGAGWGSGIRWVLPPGRRHPQWSSLTDFNSCFLLFSLNMYSLLSLIKWRWRYKDTQRYTVLIIPLQEKKQYKHHGKWQLTLGLAAREATGSGGAHGKLESTAPLRVELLLISWFWLRQKCHVFRTA